MLTIEDACEDAKPAGEAHKYIVCGFCRYNPGTLLGVCGHKPRHKNVNIPVTGSREKEETT